MTEDQRSRDSQSFKNVVINNIITPMTTEKESAKIVERNSRDMLQAKDQEINRESQPPIQRHQQFVAFIHRLWLMYIAVLATNSWMLQFSDGRRLVVPVIFREGLSSSPDF